MRIKQLLALPQYGAAIYLIGLYQKELTFWMNVTFPSISTSSTQKLMSQMLIKDNGFRLITTTNIKVKKI